ncbi:MAG: methyltransferase domain-containing protein [Chthoniobacteraceae bacterium]
MPSYSASTMSRAFDPDEPEMMDRPQPVSRELEADLANLVSLNRHFGSHRLVRTFLRGWFARGNCYRVLDLCTGSGDLPRVMIDWARTAGVTLKVEAVEANRATVEIARRLSADYPEIEYVCRDALRYSSETTFDLVVCSLALHHFSEEDAVRLLRLSRRLAHRYVLVTDLERGPATTFGIWFLTQFIYREAMTRHDGRLSAQRAFSFSEMRALAEQAQWPAFAHARFLFCRQALWLDIQQLGDIPVDPVMDDVLPSPA